MAHKPTVADQLIAFLKEQGVERIYGLVGDSLNPITDALRRDGSIVWVPVHNEEAAAFAAAAESRLTGRLAVCAASCGPGNTHLVQGLFDAQRTGAKVLAIASHIPSGQIGTSFFQATHPEHLFQECSEYCELVNSPRQAARVLHSAVQTAVVRNGVGVVVMPGDVAEQESVEVPALGAVAQQPAERVPSDHDVHRLLELIERSKKPMLFVGAGARGAHTQIMALAQKLKSPVGHALGGKEWIQYDNPFDVGMSGLLGYGACHDALDDCDLLLMLGTDFPYDDFLPQTTIVQIDRDGMRLGRRAKLDLALEGDLVPTLDKLLPLVEERRDNTWLTKMLKEHSKLLDKVVGAYTRKVEKMKPIHPEYVASVIDELADDDAVFTVDTGMCNVWAARYVTPNERRRVLGSWHHGTMANALPHAIGAAASQPGRQVISFSGDGGLSMLMGELLTVSRLGLDVKIVVFNNSSLGMVKLEMLVDSMPDYGTDGPSVDFAAVAGGCGLPSVRIEDPKKLPKEMEKALSAKGPMLIDVVTDPDALSLPPEVTIEQMSGFGTAMAKTVMAGGVGKMASMAKSNLRNIPR